MIVLFFQLGKTRMTLPCRLVINISQNECCGCAYQTFVEYVVVQFILGSILISLCLIPHYHVFPYIKTEENKHSTSDKIEPQHTSRDNHVKLSLQHCMSNPFMQSLLLLRVACVEACSPFLLLFLASQFPFLVSQLCTSGFLTFGFSCFWF